jgi:N-acetylmuramoyl-L-alanine amidase
MNELFAGLGKELRANGCKVKQVTGWQSRGSSSFSPRGIMFHHTASAAGNNAPALGIVTHGRSDLPGPLCQFLVARDGTIYFIAAGRANHAGTGGPLRGIPQDSGNSFTIGVECENNGVGEKWPELQQNAIATLYAVLLRRIKRNQSMVMGHKEWTSRKIDPHPIEMDSFRGRVRSRIKGLGQKRFRVTAIKTQEITGGKRARAWAKVMRLRKFKTAIKEL